MYIHNRISPCPLNIQNVTLLCYVIREYWRALVSSSLQPFSAMEGLRDGRQVQSISLSNSNAHPWDTVIVRNYLIGALDHCCTDLASDEAGPTSSR